MARCCLLLLFLVPLLPQDRAERRKALFAPLPPITPAKLSRSKPVDFTTEIKPILEAKCEYCHGGPVKEGRYDLASHEAMLKGGKTGRAIVPGKPDDSFFYKLVSRQGVPPMPPNGEETITPEELALLRLWIAEGAAGPAGGSAARRTLKLGPVPRSLQAIHAVAISPDGRVLAIGQANRLLLHDVASGKPLAALADPTLAKLPAAASPAAQLDMVQSLAFAPDGKTLAAGGFQELVLWDVASRTVKARMGEMPDRIPALDFSADGKWLAAASGGPTEEAELRLFDASSGKLVAKAAAIHTDQVNSLRFSPDGSKLATAGADRFVRVFNVPKLDLHRNLEGHTQAVLDVGWRAEGKQVVSASADHTLKVWDCELGEQVRGIAAHGKEINRLLIVPGLPQAISISGDGSAKLWNLDNGQMLRAFVGAADVLHAGAISPDGKVLVTAGEEGVARIHDTQNGQVRQTLKPGQ